MKVILCFFLFTVFFYSCWNIESGDRQVEPDTPRMEDAVRLLTVADSFYHANEYDSAGQLYSIYLETDSACAGCYYKRGFCFVMQGFEFRELAIADLKRAAGLKYRLPDCYYNLGLLHSFYDDEKALHFFTLCLDLDPDHVKAKKELAFCRWRMAKERR